MMTGRHIPAVLAVLAGCSVAGCNLPDPDFQGKMHEEATPSLSRPEILAGVLTRVAANAEAAEDYQTAELIYRRAHKMGSTSIDTSLGLARSLAAMNEPLAASEAYGAALAIDEHNEEAVAGLAKTLEMVAANSAKNRPADMPPPPAKASADASPDGAQGEPEMSDMAMSDTESPDKDMSDTGMSEKGDGDDSGTEMAKVGDAGTMAPKQMMDGAADQTDSMAASGDMADKTSMAPDSTGAMAAPMAGATDPGDAASAMGADGAAQAGSAVPTAASGSKVKLNDVLSAIEWKADKAATVPGGVPQAAEPEGVQTANSNPTTVPPMATDGMMAKDGNAPAPAMTEKPMAAAPTMAAPTMAAPMGGTSDYRLQFGAFGNAPRAEVARARISAKAKSMLGDIALQVEKVESGSGKPVYKLRSSGVGGRTNAAALCARLKAQSIGCFLVKPTRANAKPARKAAVNLPSPPNPVAMAGKSAAPTPPAAKENPVIRWEVVEGLNTDPAAGSAPKAPAAAASPPTPLSAPPMATGK